MGEKTIFEQWLENLVGGKLEKPEPLGIWTNIEFRRLMRKTWFDPDYARKMNISPDTLTPELAVLLLADEEEDPDIRAVAAQVLAKAMGTDPRKPKLHEAIRAMARAQQQSPSQVVRTEHGQSLFLVVGEQWTYQQRDANGRLIRPVDLPPERFAGWLKTTAWRRSRETFGLHAPDDHEVHDVLSLLDEKDHPSDRMITGPSPYEIGLAIRLAWLCPAELRAQYPGLYPAEVQVYFLVEQYKLTGPELARALGRSHRAVRVHLHRAKANLAKQRQKSVAVNTSRVLPEAPSEREPGVRRDGTLPHDKLRRAC